MLVDTKWARRKLRDRVLCPYTNVITAFVIGDRCSVSRNKWEVSWCLGAASCSTAGLYRLLFQDIVNVVQGGSNMTGTDLYVNKPHCAAAVRP